MGKGGDSLGGQAGLRQAGPWIRLGRPQRAERTTPKPGWAHPGDKLNVPVAMRRHVFLALMDARQELGLRDAGDGARGALRIEAGRCACGAEPGPDKRPFEATRWGPVRGIGGPLGHLERIPAVRQGSVGGQQAQWLRKGSDAKASSTQIPEIARARPSAR